MSLDLVLQTVDFGDLLDVGGGLVDVRAIASQHESGLLVEGSECEALLAKRTLPSLASFASARLLLAS